MPIVRIDATRIRDFNTFHAVFAEALGFPDFYGRNMNAWIDCMSDLGEGGMADVAASESDPLVIWLDRVDAMPEEVLRALTDCTAFVNWRNGEAGSARIALAYHRSPPP
jgi:hypothetical protein